MKMTTLCYIEKDGQYLMLHRTKKKKDINKDIPPERFYWCAGLKNLPKGRSTCRADSSICSNQQKMRHTAK